MGGQAETPKEKPKIVTKYGELEEGNFIKFRDGSDEIHYGAIHEIFEKGVQIAVGVYDGAVVYKLYTGNFKQRVIGVLSAADVAGMLNRIRQTIA